MDLVIVQARREVEIEDLGVSLNRERVPSPRDGDAKAAVDGVSSALPNADSEVGAETIL
jgi:hypothetical protein